MDENSAQDMSPLDKVNNKEVIRDLVVWRSFSRPPFVMGKEEFTTAVSVCLLLSIILAFFGEIPLIGFVWASLFLVTALSKRPPEEVEHKITTQGITSMGTVYLWETLGAFWFSHRGKYPLLHVSSRVNMFSSLVIVLPKDQEIEKEIREILAEYIPYIETVEKTRIEKVTDWMVEKLSLNRDK